MTPHRTEPIVRSSFLLLAFSLAPLACAGTPTGTADLDGTVWTLASLPDRGVLPGTAVTLRFEGGRAGGSDGCNTYGAPYQQDGDWFELGEVASTQMACDEEVMDQGGAYLAALDAARTVHRAGDRLTLRDAEGEDVAELTLQSQSLEGTAWTVTGYDNGKEAVVSVLAGTTLSLSFEPAGHVSGSGGCNRLAGAYLSSGPDLAITNVGATRKMCAEPEGVMEQEALFLAALSLAAKARVDGARLELRTVSGALVVTAMRSAGE
jgi:heat shock protein HslJ